MNNTEEIEWIDAICCKEDLCGRCEHLQTMPGIGQCRCMKFENGRKMDHAEYGTGLTFHWEEGNEEDLFPVRCRPCRMKLYKEKESIKPMPIPGR